MSEDRLKEIEGLFASVEVDKGKLSAPLESPAGDAAVEFLDKQFTILNEWLSLKLKDGLVKTIVISQVNYLYAAIRAAVVYALK